MPEINIDWDALNKTAEQVHDAQYASARRWFMPPFVAAIYAGLEAGIVWGAYFIWQSLVQIVLAGGTYFATTILGVITKARTENARDFNEVIAAALSELLGYEINPDQFSTGQGPQGMNQRVESIGRALHDMLRNEFVQGGEITPEQGKANAEKFSGFAINFATGSAFVSILTEAVSIGFLKQFRELGVETAQALGLGRLQRLAMQPLIRNAIQQPYDAYYRKILRPDRLSEAQAVRAFRAGNMSEDALRDQLASKGYRDQDIDILIDQLSQKVTATEFQKLIRYNAVSEQDAIDRLTNQGMDNDDAKLLLKTVDAGRADSQLSAILGDLETARLEGFLSQDEFTSDVQDLPIGPEEQSLYLKKIGLQLERPRKKLTLAQVKAGVIAGIVDFDYLDTFLKNEGYSDQDNLILTYEVIQALATAEEKAAAKAKKAAALQAKGQPVPAPLTTP